MAVKSLFGKKILNILFQLSPKVSIKSLTRRCGSVLTYGRQHKSTLGEVIVAEIFSTSWNNRCLHTWQLWLHQNNIIWSGCYIMQVNKQTVTELGKSLWRRTTSAKL